MNLLTSIVGDSLYLDANIIIYASEGGPFLSEALKSVLLRIDAGELTATTSELSLAEVLVRPLRNGNLELASLYQKRLTSSGAFRIASVSRELLVEAARLRGTYPQLRLPDAIHAATALSCHCSTFVTNDNHFAIVPNLAVLPLANLK